MSQFEPQSSSVHEDQMVQQGSQEQKGPLKVQNFLTKQKRPNQIQRMSSEQDIMQLEQKRLIPKSERFSLSVKPKGIILPQQIFGEEFKTRNSNMHAGEMQNKIIQKLSILPMVEKMNLLRHLECPEINVELIKQSQQHMRRQSSDIASDRLKENQQRHKLTFHVLSTHGSRAECGLTEIDVYDHSGVRIDFIQSVKVFNSPLDNIHNISRVSDGHTYTVDEQHMWSCHLPINNQDHIRLEMIFLTSEKVGGIKIWNYNKSLLDSKIGIRQVEIQLDGLLIYQGSIKQGSGQINQDYSHYIPINYEGDKKKDYVRPSREEPIQQSILVKQHHFGRDVNQKEQNYVGKGSFNQEKSSINHLRMSINDSKISIDPIVQNQKKQIPIKTHPKVLKVFQMNEQRQQNILMKDSSKQKIIQQSQRGNSAGCYGLVVSPQTKTDQVRILSEQSLIQFNQNRHEQNVSLQEQSTPNVQQIQSPVKLNEVTTKTSIVSKVPQTFLSGRRTDKNLISSVASIASRLDNKFKIPELPCGRFLKFNIISNHGDRKYIGLEGIEIFDENGANMSQNMVLLKVQGQDQIFPIEQFQGLTTQQSSVLIANQKFSLEYDLGAKKKISMIRIWNYSKSRIYCDRGVSRMQGKLDEQNLFSLDIRKATSNKIYLIENCEIILFTTNPTIMDLISSQDWLQYQGDDEANESELFKQSFQNFFGERPGTGDPKKLKDNKALQSQFSKIRYDNKPTKKQNFYSRSNDNSYQSIRANEIQIEFLAPLNHQVGLTGIELLDEDMQPLQNIMIKSLQPMKNKSQINFDVLMNQFLTTDEKKMVVFPWTQGQGIKMIAQQNVNLRAIKIYNYNAMVHQSSTQGVRLIKIRCAGLELTAYLRPGPQIAGYVDYAQTILLVDKPYLPLPSLPNFKINQTYEHNLPAVQGSVIQFDLIQNHGDPHYIGLNGFDIYDHDGTSLVSKKLQEFKIIGVPNLSADQRQVSNLLNLPHDQSNSFLAPFVNTPYEQLRQIKQDHSINKIILLLDNPMTITAIDFWNYTKDPERGVKDVHIYVDCQLVYQAQLNQAKPTTICFSKRQQIHQLEDAQESIRFFDEGRVIDENPPKNVKTLHDLIQRPPTRGAT